jgi:hypothetical protein
MEELPRRLLSDEDSEDWGMDASALSRTPSPLPPTPPPGSPTPTTVSESSGEDCSPGGGRITRSVVHMGNTFAVGAALNFGFEGRRRGQEHGEGDGNAGEDAPSRKTPPRWTRRHGWRDR